MVTFLKSRGQKGSSGSASASEAYAAIVPRSVITSVSSKVAPECHLHYPVDARPARDLADAGGDVVGAVVQRVVGPGLPGELGLLGGARGRYHLCPPTS